MKAFFCFMIFISAFATPVFAAGKIEGQVIYGGEPLPAEEVAVKSDKPACGDTKRVQKLMLSGEGGVANAVVTILGAEGTLEPRDGFLDQQQCEFKPHVQLVSLGSKLTITSSDSVLHNAHGFYEDGTTAFNLAVPFPGVELTFKTEKPGIIKLRCDAGHTWMSAYVVVTGEPFAAVTDEEGKFSFEGVPPGQYEIEIWHEWLGRQRRSIEVKEGEQTVNFAAEKIEQE